MKLLFTTASGYGHLHPLLPLARAAVEAGDDVRLATAHDLAAWVSACGVPHVAAGRPGSAHRTPEENAELDRLGAERGYHLFTDFLVPTMTRDLLDLVRDWVPHVIVHEETEFAAPLVAALLGVPCVTQSYAAPAKPDRERATMLERLVPLWAERTDAVPRLFGDLYLDACPAPFQTDAVRSIANVQPVRPVSFDGPPGAPPSWRGSLPRPAAYVTFGTVAAFARVEVFQATIEAMVGVVPGLVVTTGPNPAGAVTAPPGVVVEQYVRQSLVLGSVDVVVSHGGAGTTLGAIEHGLPHVVMPQNPHSQLRNAERIEALGIGVHVPHGSYAEVGPAVGRVLDDPAVAAAARTMRASFAALPGPEQVLADIRRRFG
jgi:UDP:flavonoid glycosyltransferase YjiC (YdhE family)